MRLGSGEDLIENAPFLQRSEIIVDQIEAPDLTSPQFKANPYPFYARLRAQAPVFRITLPFWKAVWLVTRYDDVLMVLKDERLVKDCSARMAWLLRFAGPLNSHMLNLDPPDHTRLRTLVHKAFTPRLVLSEDELFAMVFLLLIAGYETTVNLIATGTLALLQNPQQRDRLQQNPALAESAIEELLRYTSPLEIASVRLTLEEVTIGSVTLPRGELVLAVLGSANHDESQFPDAHTLDITREPNKHLAFGQGVHFCLGAPLARLEGQIALTTLFRGFPICVLPMGRSHLAGARD